MDNTVILEQLTGIFREVFDDDNLVVTPELSAKDVPDWDSVNHIRLVVSIETEFKLRFTVEEIEKLQNVGDLVKLLQPKAGGGQS
jgi:acyl carrier protein